MEDALELDIEDLVVEEDGYVITTLPENFLSVKDKLEELGYDKFTMAEVTMIPSNYVTLEGESLEKAIGLVEALEDLDDVQSVYHNLDM